MVVLLLMKEKEIFLLGPGMMLFANLRRLTFADSIDFQKLNDNIVSNVEVTFTTTIFPFSLYVDALL